MFMKSVTLALALLPVATSPADVSADVAGAYLHARPGAVIYGTTGGPPDLVIFSTTNDGKVQAVNGSTGEKLWALPPNELVPSMTEQFVDSDAACLHPGTVGEIVPVTADRDRDGTIETVDGDFVHLVFGMRQGGHSIYSLDVTDRFNPTLNWRIASSSAGQSWSKPAIARIDTNRVNFSTRNIDKAVVIVAGGYETLRETALNPISQPAASDVSGASIVMLDLYSGAVIWRAGPDTAADLTLDLRSRPGLTRSIPGQIRVVDMNSDGFADRMYASDAGGRILRFDIYQGREPNGIGANAMVAGGVIAQLSAEAMASPSDSDARHFSTSPDVSVFYDPLEARRFVAISIGSGYRAHPADTIPIDRFFSIRDPDVFNQLAQAEYDDYPIVTESDLVEVSGALGTTIQRDRRGWMLTLPENQKVLSSSVTFDNDIFFVTFAPETDAAPTCSTPAGRNFLYRVNVVNGDPAADSPDDAIPGSNDRLRVRELRRGGIAPAPRFLFPKRQAVDCTGSECAPPPMGCIGVDCFKPGFANRPVRTVWTRNGVE
jgi:type IV pilus assembly protein PilY1